MSITQRTTVVPSVRLNDGHSIPQLGFGVFQIDPADTAEAVSTALEVGYRHIDTAEMYRNERGVGEAVRASGLDRAEVFITSKLNNRYHRPDDARRAFETTLTELGFDYVDLFLIHWPLPTLYGGDFVSTWKTLEEFHEDGRARSIGVSNFQVEHLERLASATDQAPAVNQIELHPYLLNEQVRAYDEAHGIATRGVVADRAGRRPRRPGDHRDRRQARASHRHRWCFAGTSSAATSSSPSPRLPLGSRRTLSSLIFSSRLTTSRRSPRSTKAKLAGPARTPTRSPTSPPEPCLAAKRTPPRPAYSTLLSCS